MSKFTEDMDDYLNGREVPERSKEMDRKMLRLRDETLNAMRKARTDMAQMEATLLAYMDEHACHLEISDTERLYVGYTRTTKSWDDQGILMAILEAGGGNLELLTTGEGGLLASQPWKAGAVRDLIGEDKFKKCFTVDLKMDLKTGKPARQVKVIDQRFGA